MTFITKEQNTYIVVHTNIVLAYICDTTKSTKKHECIQAMKKEKRESYS